MTTAPKWTDEETQKLRDLIRQGGLSASQIGNHFGKSRNAVIGKALRLGLRLPGAVGPMGSFRAMKPKPPKAPKPAGKPVQAVPVAKVLPYREPDPRPPGPPPRPGVSYFRTCQWIDGDPKSPDWKKCGHPTSGSSAYCEEHHRMVYVPVQPQHRKAIR